MPLSTFMEMHGEVFEIRRDDEVKTAKGLPNRDGGGQKYVGFYPGTDVAKGDELTGTVSGNRYTVTGIERQLMRGEVFQVKAYYDEPSRRPHGNTINVGSMMNSTIQQASPGATQHIEISQENREAASELVRAVGELVGQLDLSADHRDELETEVETINTVLSSPNPKPSILRKCFSRVRGTLGHLAGVATSAVAGAATKDVIGRIDHYLSQWGS